MARLLPLCPKQVPHQQVPCGSTPYPILQLHVPCGPTPLSPTQQRHPHLSPHAGTVISYSESDWERGPCPCAVHAGCPAPCLYTAGPPTPLQDVAVSSASSREPLGLPVGGPRGGEQAASELLLVESRRQGGQQLRFGHQNLTGIREKPSWRHCPCSSAAPPHPPTLCKALAIWPS